MQWTHWKIGLAASKKIDMLLKFLDDRYLIGINVSQTKLQALVPLLNASHSPPIPVPGHCCQGLRHPQQQATSSPRHSLFERISLLYRNAIRILVSFLRSSGWERCGLALGVVALDLVGAVRGAWHRCIYGSSLHSLGANPSSLTPEELSRAPLILLHGCGPADPTSLVPLIQGLSQVSMLTKEFLGPIFVPHLPNLTSDAIVAPTVLEALGKALQAISELYQKSGQSPPYFHLVGHSSGARAALCFLKEKDTYTREEIGKVIMLTEELREEDYKDLSEENRSKLYGILARWDFKKRLLNLQDSQKSRISAGHLGVLAHNSTHQIIAKLCSSSS
jgi:hypothetical protein